MAVTPIANTQAQLTGETVLTDPVDLATQATGQLPSANLADSGVIPGTYGDSTHVAQVTVNAKGQVTTASDVAISITGGITQLTGDVTAGPGTGSQAATIANNAVTNAKLAQMAAHTFKGNNTGSTANAADLTASQATAELNAMVGDSGSGGTKGLVPAPAAGDAAAGKFLKADGTFAVPAGSGSGTVTNTGTLTSGRLIAGNGGVDVTVTDLTGDITTSGGVATALKTAAKTRAITFAVDGGGSAITTGVKADVYIPYACTITAVTMLADQSGSCVVDIWKDTYANYPPTVADTITASAKPTISAATKSQDTTLTGWTTSISAGNTLRFNIDSASTITRLSLTLTVTV